MPDNKTKLWFRVFGKLNRMNLLHWIPDDLFLKIYYYGVFGKKLNLDNPQTFNEKLQWLKLHDRNPEYTRMVDKYEAKKYVAEKIGEQYIIPTLGVWDNFDDIDFDKLPEQFVLKCTHDCGGLVICKDKSSFNIIAAKKKINNALNINYFWNCREWPYKKVKPRIIAEKYMEDSKLNELRDYKFFCFNGKVHCFKIDFDRYTYHRANYFDINKNILPFGETVCPPDFTKKILIPDETEKMIKLAESLSVGIPFIRVDFYSVDNKIYFGELTLYPNGGIGPFYPDYWDISLGKSIILPIE